MSQRAGERKRSARAGLQRRHPAAGQRRADLVKGRGPSVSAWIDGGYQP